MFFIKSKRSLLPAVIPKWKNTTRGWRKQEELFYQFYSIFTFSTYARRSTRTVYEGATCYKKKLSERILFLVLLECKLRNTTKAASWHACSIFSWKNNCNRFRELKGSPLFVDKYTRKFISLNQNTSPLVKPSKITYYHPGQKPWDTLHFCQHMIFLSVNLPPLPLPSTMLMLIDLSKVDQLFQHCLGGGDGVGKLNYYFVKCPKDFCLARIVATEARAWGYYLKKD